MQIPQPQTQGQRTLHHLQQQLEARWYAVYVVARHEKVVAQQLVRRSLESFLPLYHAVHRWKKRRAEVKLPPFPSYLFVRIPAADRLRILEIPGVVHVVSSFGVPVVVPKEDIETLRTVFEQRRSQ